MEPNVQTKYRDFLCKCPYSPKCGKMQSRKISKISNFYALLEFDFRSRKKDSIRSKCQHLSKNWAQSQ